MAEELSGFGFNLGRTFRVLTGFSPEPKTMLIGSGRNKPDTCPCLAGPKYLHGSAFPFLQPPVPLHPDGRRDRCHNRPLESPCRWARQFWQQYYRSCRLIWSLLGRHSPPAILACLSHILGLLPCHTNAEWHDSTRLLSGPDLLEDGGTDSCKIFFFF